jgi:hypothetical protein
MTLKLLILNALSLKYFVDKFNLNFKEWKIQLIGMSIKKEATYTSVIILMERLKMKRYII